MSNVHLIDDTDGGGNDDSGVSSLGTDLARLRKDAEAYAPKPLRYVHPTLPQYILVFRADLDWEQMEAWRRKCVTKPARNGREAETDASKFGRMVVSGTSIGIEHRGNSVELTGTPMVDSRGNDVTFTNREFMAEFGVATGADAVKAFIMSDSAVAALSNRIIDDNGVGQEVEALPDPTAGA